MIGIDFTILMQKKDKTDEDRILLQCIAALSSHPNYQKMTPWVIFEKIRELSQGLYEEEEG